MPRAKLLLEPLPPLLRWLALIAGSMLVAAALMAVRLPAAFLLGPMLAAIALEAGGGGVHLPRALLYVAQAVIGCMIARALTPEILAVFEQHWPIFLGVIAAVVGAASLIGAVMTRWRILPGTTAVWGMAPGAASAIVFMAGEFGADTRLVAFMQYLRVVLVAIFATVVARFWVGPHPPAAAVAWFPALHALPFAETLAIALVGGVIGRVARVPAGVFLVPMVLGALLHSAGLVQLELPPWLLAASYACVGWSIGLGFTRDILAHALRALPQTLAAIIALMLFAAGLALILVRAFGVDPLTAYLATSPGGVDSVAIVAASSRVDLSFVMALQTVRFLFVLLAGPAVSRLVAARLEPRAARTAQARAPAARMDATLAQVREGEGELD
jgi:membrane AbrB-like protein